MITRTTGSDFQESGARNLALAPPSQSMARFLATLGMTVALTFRSARWVPIPQARGRCHRCTVSKPA